MHNSLKLLSGCVVCCFVLLLAISLGSADISISITVRSIAAQLFGQTAGLDQKTAAIVWSLRFPRALLSFCVGGALSVSGAVFQSVLKNQLASPYILGVSSGASLGAGLVMLTGFSLPFLGGFTLPAVGFVFGLGTVLFAIALSSRIDKNLSSNTIILFGMVLSLFLNAILTTLTALYREELRNLLYWQIGSFALKSWNYLGLMLPFLCLGLLGVFCFTRELDALSFGEEQAASLGVDAHRMRVWLLVCSATLTGAAVALSGAIGFIDLVAPHAARRLVGASHRWVIPMAFITGGCLLTASDLAARTLVSPSELPVGAITAIIGAPFFTWIYFNKSR
ncbi:FecCD family ABC transporter permease [Breznakiellaceae bacterium SP9]